MCTAISSSPTWQPIAAAAKQGVVTVNRAVDEVKLAVSPILGKVGEFFYEGSILHAFDNDRLISERQANLNLTASERRWKGVRLGAKSFLQGIISIIFMQALSTKCAFTSLGLLTASTAMPTFFVAVVVAPLLEELIFRGIFQNAIHSLQNAVKSCFSEATVVGNRAISWLLSPSCRVVMTSAIFAAAHLGNSGHAVIQALSIFLRPTESIIYETTGIDASIASHATNNVLCSWPLLLV